MKDDSKKIKKSKSKVKTILGNMAVFTGSVIIATKILPKISDSVNRQLVKKANKLNDEEDWGPVMERKKKGDNKDAD